MTELASVPVGDLPTALVTPGGFTKFKDTQGRFRTQSLFIEYPHENYPAHFTLKKRGHKGMVNMYAKYMEIADPTEYQVAMQLLGSWDHWQQLARTKWFTTRLTGWREELKTSMESDRYYEMLSKVPSEKAGVQATKWLADRYGASEDMPHKRGRPSKDEKAAYLKQLELDESDSDDDARRIGIVK